MIQTIREPIHAKPSWVLFGGCILAFLAAAVNADFMLRLGVSVSHLTGDLSRITSETVRAGGTQQAAILCLSLVGFISGAATAGFFIHHPQLELKRPYGRCVMAVGLLLLSTYPLSSYSPLLTCFVAAWACGMQNALATRYRGIVLRTTHITGLLTDFGQLVGMRLRGHPVETWKITTPLLLAMSFSLGATVGAVLSLESRIPVTVACGCTYVTGGAAWTVFKRLKPKREATADER